MLFVLLSFNDFKVFLLMIINVQLKKGEKSFYNNVIIILRNIYILGGVWFECKRYNRIRNS